jgi:SAM-dependent methyltransferase
MNLASLFPEAFSKLSPWDKASERYLAYHKLRYRYLMEVLDGLLRREPAGRSGNVSILDVGPSHQTTLIRLLFPNPVLATMGYHNPHLTGLNTVLHTHFDLNQACQESNWPSGNHYDLIILGEVLEHLYTPPTMVLRMFRSLLRPGGHLVIQTPNPVSLMKRLLLLKGHSPFEIIRDDTMNPGHYCEYTVPDLLYLARIADYAVDQYSVTNYFGEPNWLYDLACRLLPGPLGDGITMVLRRPMAEGPAGLER